MSRRAQQIGVHMDMIDSPRATRCNSSVIEVYTVILHDKYPEPLLGFTPEATCSSRRIHFHRMRVVFWHIQGQG